MKWPQILCVFLFLSFSFIYCLFFLQIDIYVVGLGVYMYVVICILIIGHWKSQNEQCFFFLLSFIYIFKLYGIETCDMGFLKKENENSWSHIVCSRQN